MAQPPVAPSASTRSAAGGLGGALRTARSAKEGEAWFGGAMLFCEWIRARGARRS